jgi:phosphopentomutase
MGVVASTPPPTYPLGFPPEVLEIVDDLAPHGWCCNRPYSGTDVITDFGDHHLASGQVILYTSADSVMQIAAHTDVISATDLQALCKGIRARMTGVHAVGRVIARPFEGDPGGFARTDGRKDFSVQPPSRSYLQELQAAGVPVHSVGKPDDLFAHVGIDIAHPGSTNARALGQTTDLLAQLSHGLIFTNLIDTDQVYGHRKDVEGFAAALEQIDAAAAAWLTLVRDDDLLILTSDHGVDPDAAHSDHTREHAFLLASFAGHAGRTHDGPMADVGASVLDWLAGHRAPGLPGESFVSSTV